MSLFPGSSSTGLVAGSLYLRDLRILLLCPSQASGGALSSPFMLLLSLRRVDLPVSLCGGALSFWRPGLSHPSESEVVEHKAKLTSRNGLIYTTARGPILLSTF